MGDGNQEGGTVGKESQAVSVLGEILYISNLGFFVVCVREIEIP